MGLDIYVGSFTRYYSGDWETVIARMSREQNIAFQTIRTNPDPPDKVTDPLIIGQAVEGWRAGLEAGLKPHFTEPFSWDERFEREYYTDKPDWIGFSGLLLLAAHLVCPGHPRPKLATARFDEDAAYQALEAREFQCRFSQLFEVEVWLPCPFSFTFKAEDVAGNQRRFGSSITLLQQLLELNDETFRGDAATLEQWTVEAPGSEDSFDKSATFGVATFLRHARLSVEHRLPMMLDY